MSENKLPAEVEYFGNCPYCGVQLGFGHIPNDCSHKHTTEKLAKCPICSHPLKGVDGKCAVEGCGCEGDRPLEI